MESIEITLGISATYGRYSNAIEVARKVRNIFSKIVVVIQEAEADRKEVDGNISVYFSPTIGLSKSRNILLRNSETRWLWINDDDVDINFDHVEIVRKRIEGQGDGVTLFAGRIGCSDCLGMYKKYRFRWLRPLLFAQISSIEIIVDRDWCLKNDIEFDPQFGLGARFPTSEEPIFASDIVKSGGKIHDIEQIIVNHPCRNLRLSPEQSWKNRELTVARACVAARISGWRGLTFLLFGVFRSFISGRSLANSFLMITEYMKYGK